MDLYVYFDFSKKGDNLIVAAVGMESAASFIPKIKKVEVIEYSGCNQYEMVLYALDNALNMLRQYKVEGNVFLHHQNSILVSWLEKLECSAAYINQFYSCISKFEDLAVYCDFRIHTIEAKQNIAKKFCKSELIPKSPTQYRQLTFEVKQPESGKVIKFMSK